MQHERCKGLRIERLIRCMATCAGIFAHQTPIFDSFTASADYPMQITTEAGKGGPKASALMAAAW